jgi:hypothetical protein
MRSRPRRRQPIGLAEVGAPPTSQILDDEPRWTWFTSRGEPSGEAEYGEALRGIYESKETLTLEKLPWVHLKQPKGHHPILE